MKEQESWASQNSGVLLIAEIYDKLRFMRPVVNADALERKAGIPSNTIAKHWLWLDGNEHGRKCPEKHLKAVAEALAIEPNNGGFVPSPSDTKYMNDETK